MYAIRDVPGACVLDDERFPRRGGVNPASSRVAPNTRTFPRTSGGDPNVRNMDMDGTSFSLCEDETGCLERLKAVDTFSPHGG